MQGASEQCMQATDIERSPGLPSFKVTTRRRLIPQGTSFSFLHAVTQALHSMQRSASHKNFILAIIYLLTLLQFYIDYTSIPAFASPSRTHTSLLYLQIRLKQMDQFLWDICPLGPYLQRHRQSEMA